MQGVKDLPSWWDNIPKEYKIRRTYHTTWQRHSGMRFILLQIVGKKAQLTTKYSSNKYWSDLSELRDTNKHKN